ncbi:MAG: DUF4876 domain-containing protein [Marinifilaceae bacterium]
MTTIFKTNLFKLCAVALVAIATACSDPVADSFGTVTLTVEAPDNIEATNIQALITEKNSGTKTTLSMSGTQEDITLKTGIYTITVEASYTDEEQTLPLAGIVEGISVLGNQTMPATVRLHKQSVSDDFVLEELFFTGTQTPEGKNYTGDTYFKITNNSSRVLYADGLAIAESAFLTTTKYNYTPDIMSQAFAVKALYRVPGNGSQYAVQPGESIVICDIAIDHRQANPNSIDLSKADFEWFDDFENANVSDVDNPNVPNLEKIYSASKTLWTPHNRGFSSYALIRMDNITAAEYLANYKYDYEYDMVLATGTFHKTGSNYQIPNTWIIDAVNLSVATEYQWLLTDASLDRGWTFCGTINNDNTRYGKSVRRKTYTDINGITRLQDTNNSADDFMAECTPSLKSI